LRSFSARRMAILALIIAVALSLMLVLYQDSIYTSQKIEEIAVREIRSNAEIQVHDLSNSLSNRLRDIANDLNIISNSPAVQANRFEDAKILFNTAESVTEGLVDFYMWLDKDGRIVWISNINQTTYETYRGSDLSYRLYYEIPKETYSVYYSSVTDSNDGISRLYISHPILTPDVQSEDKFRGVVVAGIRTDVIGTYLEGQLSPKFQSEVAFLDNTGILLYHEDSQYVGKNVFGVKFQALISSADSKALAPMNEGFKAVLRGESGTEELLIQDRRMTYAYDPVMIDEQQFGALYVLATHEQAADVALMIAQQRNTGLLLILTTGAVAAGIIAVIFMWNKRLQETVNERTSEVKSAYERLKKQDSIQREFINIAAHELRTPVQPILGMANLLEDDFNGKDKVELQKEDLDIIVRNARRLERLTSDILQVARIESNTLRLNEEVFDLNEKIKDAVSDVTSTMTSDKKVKIEFVPSGEKPLLVKADKGKILEVLHNLLRNSLKFTNDGAVTVFCQKDETNGHVIVKVKDTGSGIGPEIMPRLFEKFFTRSDSGTGLGLFISRSIVEAHGGSIWAENNRDGRGATFTFTLPMPGSNP
jgi:signal transduction histidine kinase